MRTSEAIFSIFERSGAAAYFGEPVSVTEHGLQAAQRVLGLKFGYKL